MSSFETVKITDFERTSAFLDNDLYLIARSQESVQDNYANYAINGGSMLSGMKDYLEKTPDLSVNGSWAFVGGNKKIPKIEANLDPSEFVEALQDGDKLNSVLNPSQSGWYADLSTTVVEKNSSLEPVQSLSVTNDSAANVSFVERIVAEAYNALLQRFSSIAAGDFIPSKPGDIIFSTKLSTAGSGEDGQLPGENNVRRYYGYGQTVNGIKYPNTQWRAITYILSGSTSSVTPNSNSSDGGAASSTATFSLNANQIPHHAHTISDHKHNIPSGTFVTSVKTSSKSNYDTDTSGASQTAIYSVSASKNSSSVSTSNVSLTTSFVGSGAQVTTNPFSVIPPHKNVYIWERTA